VLKRPATLELDKRYLNNLKANCGDLDLREYDSESLDGWKATLRQKVSATTVNIAMRSLRAAFNKAKRWGYVDLNPFDGMQALKVQEKRQFLTEEEIVGLFKVIDADIEAGKLNIRLNKAQRAARKRNRLYFEFLLNTGLRRAEAINLRAEDVNFEKESIYIVHATKSYRSRVVPMNERVKEILKEVMPDLFSKINKETVTQKFAEYLKRTGLVGFKLHSLRHTFASRLVEHGVDLYTVSKLLGHSDLKTSMVYAKVSSVTLRNAVGKLDGKTL
jgi:integrase